MIEPQPSSTDLTCDDCGKQGSDVVETICPFQDEIYGVRVPATLCPECSHNRYLET